MVALFHFGNLRTGSAFQNLSTLVKLLLIGALIVAGFLVRAEAADQLFAGAPRIRCRSSARRSQWRWFT